MLIVTHQHIGHPPIEEYFFGEWRSGQEKSKIVITQRFYQISPNSTQA